MSFRDEITRAITILGSQAKLAREMGCSQQNISWLLKEADQISAETAMLVERATRGAVKAGDLRPDLPWPVPTQPSDQGDQPANGHQDDGAASDALDVHHEVTS